MPYPHIIIEVELFMVSLLVNKTVFQFLNICIYIYILSIQKIIFQCVEKDIIFMQHDIYIIMYHKVRKVFDKLLKLMYKKYKIIKNLKRNQNVLIVRTD